MIQVKWVHPAHLEDPEKGKVSDKAIPVIELSSLAEVVEGLELLSMQQPQRSHPLWGEWVNGPDHRTKSFKQWLAQRLLAQLEEAGS